jgi:imidazolonepropionase-like amidohydrolase
METFRKRLSGRNLLAVVGGLLVGSLIVAGAEPPAGSKALALVGGEILTQTDEGAVRGTLVIRDGKIGAVGRDVAIPGDADKIDVTDFVIMPGLIDARSNLWLTAAAIRDSASDGSLDVLDGVDPHEEDWKEVIRQGVTAVYVQPAASGILGGKGAVLRVGPADSVEELVLRAGAAAQAALGTSGNAPSPTRQPALPRRFGGDPPATEPAQPAAPVSGNSLARFSQYEQLKRVFEAVKKYDEQRKKEEEADKKRNEKSTPDGKTPAAKEVAKAASSPPTKRDATKEFLRKVLGREVPLRLEVHREDDVRNALRLADEFRLRIVLDGVSNPRTASEEVVKRRIPLVLGPFVDLEEIPGYRKDRPADWPKALLTADTRWALGTFSNQPRGSRLLRIHAAAAVARGVASQSVLRAMTRDAAEILGVSDRLGSIAVGKQADVVVFAGDPLDPSVPVRLVVSGGKIVYQAEVSPVQARRDRLHAVEGLGPHAGGHYELPSRLPPKYALNTQRLLTEHACVPGMVIVENGKITGLAPALSLGEGVPTYDLGFAVLSPGLVVAHSDLGFANVIDDAAEADASQVRAADVYDPQQHVVRALLEGGFTSAVLAPGSVNIIGGTCSGVRLGTAEPFPCSAGVKFVLTAGSRGTSRASPESPDEPAFLSRRGLRGGPTRYPGSLAGQVELIEQVLSGKAPGTDLYLPSRVRQQIQMERRRQITALLERKQVAFIEAQTRAEVDAALQLIARFHLRGVLVGPEEIRPFLGEIKRLGVGIVARPAQAGDYDRSALELAEAAAAGVPVVFGSASAQELRITAALAVNAGMPREAAWHGLTSAAGPMVGLPESAGRLVVGAPADLVIWDGLPLDFRSRPLHVLIDGKVVSPAERMTR